MALGPGFRGEMRSGANFTDAGKDVRRKSPQL